MKTICLLLCLSTLSTMLSAQDPALAQVESPGEHTAPQTEVAYNPSYKLTSSESVKKYIHSHFKYPEKLIENGIEGRMIIRLNVNKEGKITGTEVVESPHPELDSSVQRLLLDPGMLSLEPFETGYTIHVPLQFSLSPF